VWDEAGAAVVRKHDARLPLVSFGWHGYAGDGDAALGEEGLDFGVGDKVLTLAAALAQRWHTVGGRGYLQWRGIPVGAAPTADLYDFFKPAVKLYYVWRHVVARYAPQEVVFVDDGSPAAALLPYLAAADRVGSWRLGAAAFARARRRLDLASRRFVWPMMFEAARRRGRAGGVAPRLDARMRRPGGAVFWGQLGSYDVDVYLALRERLGPDLPFFAATPAAARGGRRAGALCDTLYDARPPAGRVRAVFGALAVDYRALERAGLFDGFGLPPALVSYFRDRFVFRPDAYLISLAFTAAAVEAFLERWRPALVVHLSDVHLTGRLVSAMAARRGLRSLVIQNHITGGPTFGYLPLTSDLMATWGRVSRDWMVAGGAPRDRLVVVGSCYAALAAPLYRGRAASPGRAKVVVATNSFDADHNRELALAAGAWARARPDFRLVFRPHPGEGEELYRAVIRKFGLAGAEVAARAPLADVLRDAAVVVTGHSGIGVDAVVAGVPMVHVNLMRGVADYIPYVAYGAALGLGELAWLGTAVAEAAASPGWFQEGRRAFSREYLGDDRGDPFANLARLVREMGARG